MEVTGNMMMPSQEPMLFYHVNNPASTAAQNSVTSSNPATVAAAVSQLSASQLTASQLTASQLTASQLSAPQLTASHLGAAQLTAPQLTAPQLTAPQLTASQLAGTPLNTQLNSALTTPLNTSLCLQTQAQPFFPLDMKLSWSGTPNSLPKPDTSKHHHIFIGDLSPEIETAQLRDSFAHFGQLSDCKIIRDPQSLKSKGYGFVSFVNKEEAESAISGMNGQWIGSRAIRTNWASRKPPAPYQRDKNAEAGKPLVYEEVFAQASATNCTVYCGGLLVSLNEEIMHETFQSFGVIQEIRVFKDKGYAFIRFSNKESAAQAIVSINGEEVYGQCVKCAWGKEANDPSQLIHQQVMAAAVAAASVTPGAPTYATALNAYGQPAFFNPAAYYTGYAAAPVTQTFSTTPTVTPTVTPSAAAAAIAQSPVPASSFVQPFMQPNFIGYGF